MLNVRETEKVLKAVANRRRLSILAFLKKRGEATVGEIAEDIKLSFGATSRHLILMEHAGILDKEQRSIEVHYRIPHAVPAPVRSLLGSI